MSYDNLSYSTMEPPFFQENRLNPQSFRQEDLMDIETSWIDNIDPLLRQSQIGSPDLDYQQDLPRQPLQRFITEPERALFTAGPTMNHFDNFARTLPRAFEPLGVLPHTSRARMISPSPSQELSSSCSSARSPGTETDWYHDGYYSSQGQDDYTLPNTHTTSSQNFSDIWSRLQTQSLQSPDFPCVNLSDVQGFPDPQEIKFESDEVYTDMDIHTDCAIQAPEPRSQKLASIGNYRDEGLGASVRDAGSPPRAISVQASNNGGTSIASDVHVDVDAEGDFDEIDGVGDGDANADVDVDVDIDSDLLRPDIEGGEDGEQSDTEYTPRPTIRRSRKRASPTKFISSPNAKRNCISKVSSSLTSISSSTSATSTKSSKSLSNCTGLTCKQCSTIGFKDNATLQRHIAFSHTRAYICVFDFAGCNSTFASKNEWKRHVSSQHLNLQAWVCTLGCCGKVPLNSSSGVVKGVMNKGLGRNGGRGMERNEKMAVERGYEVLGAEFNRKDLFTQHLRRMHAPFEVKRKGKRNVEWDERVRELQKSCEIVRREAPRRLGCPIRGCGVGENGVGVLFEGRGCWDERMEHLGKHLERIGDGTSVRELGVTGGRMGASGLGRMGGSDMGENKINQEHDPLFLEWAVRVGIIERSKKGKWCLCGGIGGHGWARKRSGNGNGGVGGPVGNKVEEEDLDAEGEDE